MQLKSQSQSQTKDRRRTGKSSLHCALVERTFTPSHSATAFLTCRFDSINLFYLNRSILRFDQMLYIATILPSLFVYRSHFQDECFCFIFKGDFEGSGNWQHRISSAKKRGEMPFFGVDWRSPGEVWIKTDDGWEKQKILECRQYSHSTRYVNLVIDFIIII